MSVRCVALLGSGLDGRLAIALLQQQHVDVVAATLQTVFTSQSDAIIAAAAKLNVPLEYIAADAEYFERLRHPRFGYTREMAPCLDCRVLMLRAAKRLMLRVEASFIVTGDVVGQRLPGQSKRDLALVDFHAGVDGEVLRPLTAKLLPETKGEREGQVDRALLLGIQGRGREQQHRLAREFGWDDFPAVTSGCLLTDAAYAHRTRDLLHHWPDAPPEQFAVLRWGRHFRDGGGAKFIVGRKAVENEALAQWFAEHAKRDDLLLTPANFIGPTVLAMSRQQQAAALFTAAQLAWKHRKVTPEQSAQAAFHAQSADCEIGSVTLAVEELAAYDEALLTRL